MKRKIFNIVLLAILVIVATFSLIAQIKESKEIVELSYDQVVSYVKEGEITKIKAQEGSCEINLVLKDESKANAVVPSVDEFASFISEEIENGAEIEYKIAKGSSGVFASILSKVLTISLYVAAFAMIPKLMSSAMNDNKKAVPVESKVRFKDVAGIDEEKSQLEEVVMFLKNPNKYRVNGAKIPKGVLLNGAPGTGKTLLAKAIAGEAGVPFFQVNGSSFEEKFVGVGASRVRELFAEAKKVAPSIIFIDEIDSVAQSRYSGKNNYSEQTLNQLLAEMDGFETSDNVIVIAATNHIDVLDPALIRPGRFDRHVYVPMPDVLAREKILFVHAENKNFSQDVDLAEIARKTVGFSGADLENVMNEAAIYAVHHNEGVITSEAIDESIARVLVGLAKKNSAMTEESKYLTAVHEAGHAIVSAVARPNVKNFGISIVPRGNAGGYNFFDENTENYMRKKDLENRLKVLYGGRIAEDVILGDISSGASNDLEQATKIAYQMVMRFAMDEGSLLTKVSGANDLNGHLENKNVEKMHAICQEAYDKAEEIIKEYKNELLELADILMQREYLPEEDVELFMKDRICQK